MRIMIRGNPFCSTVRAQLRDDIQVTWKGPNPMTFQRTLVVRFQGSARIRRAMVRKVSVWVMLAAVIAMQFPRNAQATVYYWDTNGAAGFGAIGPSGWDGTNAFW